MNKILRRLNKLAEDLLEKTGRKVVAARVFTNCLCLYFENGATKFFTKKGFDWGSVGRVYFTTVNYTRKAISAKLWKEHESLIKWYEEYQSATRVRRLWLLMEYNIRYAT